MAKARRQKQVDEKERIGRMLYEMTRPECDWFYRIKLPSGNELSTEYSHDDGGYILDVSIVNDTDMSNEPSNKAFYFYDASYFSGMDSSWTLGDCIEQAEYILKLDREYQFDTESMEQFMDYVSREFYKDGLPFCCNSFDCSIGSFESYFGKGDNWNDFITDLNARLLQGGNMRDIVNSALGDIEFKIIYEED